MAEKHNIGMTIVKITGTEWPASVGSVINALVRSSYGDMIPVIIQYGLCLLYENAKKALLGSL